MFRGESRRGETRMEFGLFFLMQRDEEWSEQSVFDSGLDQMLAAESLGYSSVWIAEHHFNDYGLCPAPQVLASFGAARTKTLRLGMGVSLLPLHHPVDLAEELAVLDVVSGGRLDIGIGRGGTLQDYQTFQSDRADSRERVEEGIALMRRAWSGAPFDFKGRFHSAERLHVRPATTQRPHPPLYIAANSEDSVLSAARLGLPALQDYLADGWALIGTPDEVRDGLNRYLDATGYERVLLLMALPGLSTDLALRSMRLFADEVAPKLARRR